jgi:hypothetical protein
MVQIVFASANLESEPWSRSPNCCCFGFPCFRRYSVQKLFDRRPLFGGQANAQDLGLHCTVNHLSVRRLTSLSPTFYCAASSPKGGLASWIVGLLSSDASPYYFERLYIVIGHNGSATTSSERYENGSKFLLA